MVNKFPTFLKVIEVEAKIKILREEINKLRVKAVMEMHEAGYTQDTIRALLKMGKATVGEIIRGERTVIDRRGRKSGS